MRQSKWLIFWLCAIIVSHNSVVFAVVDLPSNQCTFEQNPSFEDDFDYLDYSKWLEGSWSFYANATMFIPKNVSSGDSSLGLTLKNETYVSKFAYVSKQRYVSKGYATTSSTVYMYTGASFQSYQKFSYGRYKVIMKPANAGGLVSSFFIFSDDDMNNGLWSEIDFEFISDPNNSNKLSLHLNHWNKATGGASGNEFIIPDDDINPAGLRDGYHELIIDYTPNYIVWFVDGIPVHVVTENIPVSDTLKLMMNIWRPSDFTYPEDGVNWAGVVNDDDLPVTAYYDYVGYYPLINCDVSTSSDFVVDFTIKRSKDNPLSVDFIGSFDYDPIEVEWNFGDGSTLLNPSNETVNHTYKKAGTYKVTLTALGGPSADKMQWSTKEEELTVPKKHSVVPVINQLLLLKKK